MEEMMAMLKKYREEVEALKKSQVRVDPEYEKYKASQRLSAEKKFAKNFCKDLLLTDSGQKFLLETGTEIFGVKLRDAIVSRIRFAEHDFSKQALQHVLVESEKEIVDDFQDAFSKKGNGVPSLTKDFAKWILENVSDALPDFEGLDLLEDEGDVINRSYSELVTTESAEYGQAENIDFRSDDGVDDADDDDDETYSPPKPRPAPNSEKKTRGRPAKDEKPQPSKRAKKT